MEHIEIRVSREAGRLTRPMEHIEVRISREAGRLVRPMEHIEVRISRFESIRSTGGTHRGYNK